MKLAVVTINKQNARRCILEPMRMMETYKGVPIVKVCDRATEIVVHFADGDQIIWFNEFNTQDVIRHCVPFDAIIVDSSCLEDEKTQIILGEVLHNIRPNANVKYWDLTRRYE